MKIATLPFESTEVSFVVQEDTTDPHKAAAIVKCPYGHIIYVALGGAVKFEDALALVGEYFNQVTREQGDLH